MNSEMILIPIAVLLFMIWALLFLACSKLRDIDRSLDKTNWLLQDMMTEMSKMNETFKNIQSRD